MPVIAACATKGLPWRLHLHGLAGEVDGYVRHVGRSLCVRLHRIFVSLQVQLLTPATT